MKYIQLSPAEKLKLLNKHSIGIHWKSLDERKWCLHCEAQFTGHSVRVYKDKAGELWLECGTPGCDGSPIDWSDECWWAEDDGKTDAQAEAMDKLNEITRSSDPERN